MATTMPEMDDQRVEVRWKVTQGDDWFRPLSPDSEVVILPRMAGG